MCHPNITKYETNLQIYNTGRVIWHGMEGISRTSQAWTDVPA